MEGIPAELIKVAPVAAALIYMCIIFLRALDKRDDRLSNLHQEWSKTLAVNTERTTVVIDRNTTALIDVKGVIDKCKRVQEA
jgi:hypothetical protein